MAGNEDAFKPINLRELGASFGIKHAPSFVYRWFEKLLHIDQINTFVENHWDDEPQVFLDNAVEYLGINGNFSGQGLEDIRTLAGKQFMVVSNHPIGGAESTLCLSHLHRINGETRLLAGEFYSLVKPMSKCCVYTKKKVRTLHDAITEGKPLLMYPAGVCSRKLSFHDVFDYRWKKGFIKMVRKANIPLVVCFTSGHASNRYLNFTKIRKFFRIKTILEASFLPDEMFRKAGSTIDFTFGKVIDPSVFTEDVDDQEWADRIRQYCYSLKKDPDAVFNPSLRAVLPFE